MSKKFFDVFPTLKLNTELQNLFEDVAVLKVTTNTNRDYLHVHLKSFHLISKKSVCEAEKAIKEQLFGGNSVQVQICENFELSRQYTPENLMREYKDSILFELKKKSVIEYNMFSNAKYHFEEENLLFLEFEDNIVAEGKAESIVSLLKEVYEVRCHMPIRIQVEYFQKKCIGNC